LYLRFITRFINEEDKPQTGIFNAMGFIRDHKSTLDEDELILKDLYVWFKNHLDVPHWYINEDREYGVRSKAFSWFKDSAREHILKINDSIIVLEKYNLIVERVTSKNPGTIVYEDEFQIAAIPFKWQHKIIK